MTKSNHSKMLPIVAATIRRRIEDCFGSADACTVPAVMLHSLTWLSQHSTCLSYRSAHPEVRAELGWLQAVSPIHRSEQRQIARTLAKRGHAAAVCILANNRFSLSPGNRRRTADR